MSSAATNTHSKIFTTIGNLVSPSSSVNGDPLDFPDHSNLVVRGGVGPPRTNQMNLSALGSYGSGNLVEGGVDNLIGFNLRSSFYDSLEELRYFWIGTAVVRFRVFCCVP